jgi:hypothetical protein
MLTYWSIVVVICIISICLIKIGDSSNITPLWIIGLLGSVITAVSFLVALVATTPNYIQIKPTKIGKTVGITVAIFNANNDVKTLTSTDTYIYDIPDSLLCIEEQQDYTKYNFIIQRFYKFKKCK